MSTQKRNDFEILNPEPGDQIWDATVLISGLIVRTHPVVIDFTKTIYAVNTWDKFTGQLWTGNRFVWIKIGSARRPELLSMWVAVRDATHVFIKLVEIKEVKEK